MNTRLRFTAIGLVFGAGLVAACANATLSAGIDDALEAGTTTNDASSPPLVTPPDGSTNDANACSSCPAFAFCEDGGCRCPVDQATVCDGACVDLRTDNSNCGQCGHGCGTSADGGGPVCMAGECRVDETYTVSLRQALVLFADDESIYVFGGSKAGGAALIRSPKSTGPLSFTTVAVVPEIYSGSQRITAVGAGDAVFMGSFGGFFRVAKSGGPVTTLSAQGTFALAASATHLYVGTDTSVLRMQLPDGPLEPYLDFGASHLAIRDDDLYVVQFVGDPSTLPASIYHVDLPTGTRMAIGTTTHVTSLSPTPDGVLWTSGLYVDLAPDFVYGERKLLHWTKNPKALKVLLQNPYSPIDGVTNDGTSIYFTNGYYWRTDEETHALSTMPLNGDGPAPMTIATALEPWTGHSPFMALGSFIFDNLHAPLVDGSFLYWLDETITEGTHVRRTALR